MQIDLPREENVTNICFDGNNTTITGLEFDFGSNVHRIGLHPTFQGIIVRTSVKLTYPETKRKRTLYRGVYRIVEISFEKNRFRVKLERLHEPDWTTTYFARDLARAAFDRQIEIVAAHGKQDAFLDEQILTIAEEIGGAS